MLYKSVIMQSRSAMAMDRERERDTVTHARTCMYSVWCECEGIFHNRGKKRERERASERAGE